MEFLGVAKLTHGVHSSGMLTKSWDLTPWGGPMVFLGPLTQPLPTGTTDKGDLRIELNTGKVWRLVPGDAPPTVGPPGEVTQTPLRGAWMLAVAGGALLLAAATRRRRRRK